MLSKLCPVNAYQEWINYAGLTKGPVFRKTNRWGPGFRLCNEPQKYRDIT
jgi:hypothetical protein